nr:hypothetical protein [Leptolyngbyaceae cyanobacterium MO_188.B28]
CNGYQTERLERKDFKQNVVIVNGTHFSAVPLNSDVRTQFFFSLIKLKLVISVTKKIMKEKNRVLLLIFLLFLGIALAFAVRAIMKMQTEGLLVGILFAPLIAYAIFFSGNLQEFAIGNKGITLKLAKAVNEVVQPDFGHIGPSLADMMEVGEKGIEALEGMLATYNLNESKPIVMSVLLGRGDYKRERTLGFIEKLSRYHSFKFVVFLDIDNKLVAYMPSWAARQLLSKPELSYYFLEIINRDGGFSELLDYPHVMGLEKTISTTDSNVKALRQMMELHQDAIVTVDENNHICGVAERERIIHQIILSLSEQQS